MYKVIGGATLSWNELTEVLLDVETQVNRRPLGYVEDDVVTNPDTSQLYVPANQPAS